MLLGALHNGEYVMSRVCVSINSRQAASTRLDDPAIASTQRVLKQLAIMVIRGRLALVYEAAIVIRIASQTAEPA